ncbi:MAG: chemotaxis protein CheA [Ferrimicrobium sp.]
MSIRPNEEIVEFLIESSENLDRLDQDLLSLEEDPNAAETIASIFRVVHTIKGTCGFLGFAHLEGVAHDGETLLARLRNRELAVHPSITDALLELEDRMRTMLRSIEEMGSDGDSDYPELRERLRRLADGEAGLAEVVAAPKTSWVFTRDDASVPQTSDEQDGAVPSSTQAPVMSSEGDRGDVRQAPEVLRSQAVDSVVRVDVSLLDRLMNLVGELVLARNQVLQMDTVQSDPALLAATQRLSLITSELQENVMKTRMQPIGTLFAKFSRVVRDLAHSCGKAVRLEVEGRETELDRTILEAIRDPLTHLVRNAIDHGIELPEERSKAGKPTEGRIRMNAYQEGGYVNIEIHDDGGGIDPNMIGATAVSRGLIGTDDLNRLSERELLELIFVPGFSTASVVTNVSGRGVGMDVVKTNVEQIGGSVEIGSTLGSGSTFKIRIPLTLAIIPALIVECAGDRFAIPQIALAELVRLERDGIEESINFVDHAPVLRRRDSLVPLLDLGALLEIGDPWVDQTTSAINVVVLQLESSTFGLVVDRIIDTQEIVVKPLGVQVNQLMVYSGATIMGDGRVALIVDVPGLARYGGLTAESRALDGDPSELRESDADGEAVLVVRVGDRARVAIPLREIDRLEQLDLTKLEWSHGNPVVQYRGQVMPLVWLGTLLGFGESKEYGEEMHVVVQTVDGRSFGVVVDDIVDINSVTDRSVVDKTAVVGGKVTQVVSLTSVLGLIQEGVR